MDYCLVLSSISCKLQKKAIGFETRISNRTVYKRYLMQNHMLAYGSALNCWNSLTGSIKFLL
jgi:hypothetical protein